MKLSQDKKQKGSIKCMDTLKLGRHTLICGDATDTKLVNRILKDIRIDAIISDPPYGVAYVESKQGFSQKLHKPKTIQNDHLQSEETYTQFTKDWLAPALEYMNPKNSIYIFNADKMVFALREGMKQAGITFSQLLIWIKNKPVIGRMDYLLQHELIAYGWYGRHKFHKSKDKSVLYCPKPHKSKLHPTMKPVSLVRRIILNSTKIGDVVYDPFGGSGTTLIAAEQTGRTCVMVEKDLEHCRTIVERYYALNKRI